MRIKSENMKFCDVPDTFSQLCRSLLYGNVAHLWCVTSKKFGRFIDFFFFLNTVGRMWVESNKDDAILDGCSLENNSVKE